MDITNQAKFAIIAIVLAILVLEEQIQTVSLVRLLFCLTKNAFLLVQMNITHQAKFAINAMTLAILVLEQQIQTV